MSMRTILLVALALLCGGSAAVGVSQLNSRGKTPGAETISVVTTTAEIVRGGVLPQESLKIQAWPKHLVPAGAVTRLEDAVGRFAIVPLVSGEPVLAGKITDKEADPGLASLIPSGMRAFTIRTPHAAAGGGGFVLPGNHVDVLVTTSASGGNDSTEGGSTTTLLQNVQVLAVDQRVDATDGNNNTDPQKLKNVTLLVTPDQATKVARGMNKGVLHLSLRNPNDKEEAATRTATMAELQFHHARPQTTASASQPVAVNGEPAADSGDPIASSEAPDSAPVPRSFVNIRTLRGEDRNHIRIDTNP